LLLSAVVVRTFQYEHEAELARAVLEAHEIPAVVSSDNAGGMIPALQPHFRTRLLVAAEDRVRAERILDSPPSP
jgi:hypothetical protein